MCNIAGYVGTRQAAPILIDMLRKQEGLDAGYYTGIATIDNGKIHYAKLVGDLDRLLENTNAASLPGTIGIIHSRTPDNTGDEWAHPFISTHNNKILTAFVLNGTFGCCKNNIPQYAKLAEKMIESGFEFRSRTKSWGNPLSLSDGTMVHASDLMCQLVAKNILNGQDTVTAMENAYCEMPEEVVGLLLSTLEKSAIAWCRINYPMHIGFAEHGAYLATAPQAFPNDAKEPLLLPALSCGYVYKDRFTCKAFKNPPLKVAPLSAKIKHDVYEILYNALIEGEKTYPELRKSVLHLFDNGDYDCTQVAAAVYGVLYDLDRQGKLKINTQYNKGIFDGLKAPIYYMSII